MALREGNAEIVNALKRQLKMRPSYVRPAIRLGAVLKVSLAAILNASRQAFLGMLRHILKRSFQEGYGSLN